MGFCGVLRTKGICPILLTNLVLCVLLTKSCSVYLRLMAKRSSNENGIPFRPRVKGRRVVINEEEIIENAVARLRKIADQYGFNLLELNIPLLGLIFDLAPELKLELVRETGRPPDWHEARAAYLWLDYWLEYKKSPRPLLAIMAELVKQKGCWGSHTAQGLKKAYYRYAKDLEDPSELDDPEIKSDLRRFLKARVETLRYFDELAKRKAFAFNETFFGVKSISGLVDLKQKIFERVQTESSGSMKDMFSFKS
jgi:hypothetical protein